MKFLIFGIISLGACGGLLWLAFNYLIPYGYQKNLLQNDIENADSSLRQELGDWLKLGIVFGVAGAGAGAFGIILLIKGQRARQTRSRGSG